MVISFMVKEARKHLEEKGFVHTLRPLRKKIFENTWYNYFRGDTKKGDVFIIFIGNFKGRENDLINFSLFSGFDSLEKWLEKAGNNRNLYIVGIEKRKSF